MPHMTTMIQTYTVIVHPAEEGGYWGEVLELPGCVSQGETIEELRDNIREAIEAVLDSQLQGTRVEFQVEPVSAEKDTLQFGVREPHNRVVGWPEASETWTAAQ